MYKENKIGPKIELRGTPQVIGAEEEDEDDFPDKRQITSEQYPECQHHTTEMAQYTFIWLATVFTCFNLSSLSRHRARYFRNEDRLKAS